MLIQVLEDYPEFQDFIVRSIPRFMLIGQRNVNLIEQMDLMRADIFCADVGGFPPLLSEKGTRYFWYEGGCSFTGKNANVQKL